MANSTDAPTQHQGNALNNIRDLNALIDSHPNFGCSLAHIATGLPLKCTECPFEVDFTEDCIFKGGRRFRDWRKALIYGFQAGLRWASQKEVKQDGKVLDTTQR